MFGMTPWKGKEPTRTTWYPEHPIEKLREEFVGLYDRLFSHLPAMVEPERFWKLEVEDNEKEVVVRAEVPGFEAEEFDIQLRGNHLVVKAEHKEETKEKKEETEVLERHTRKYERFVTLPAGTDLEKVEARYHSGVLEVKLPKTAEAMARRVPVVKT